MLNLALSLCLAATGLSAASPADTLEMKRYDLRPVLESPTRGALSAFPMLPLSTPGSYDFRDTTDVPEPLSREALYRLARRIVGPDEWEYQDRSMHLVGDNLLVTAPASIQKRLDATLTTLGHLLNRPDTLRIDTFEILNPLDLPSRISIDEYPAWIGAQLESGALTNGESFPVAVPPGQWAERQLTRTLTFVSDWNVEIAQRSAIGDPVPDSVQVGTRVQLHTAPTPIGTRVSFLFSQSRLNGFQKRSLDMMSRIAGDNVLLLSESLGTIEVPSVSLVSSATELHLATNRVACFEFRGHTEGHPILVTVRHENPERSVFTAIGSDWMALDTTLLNGIAFDVETSDDLDSEIPLAKTWWSTVVSPTENEIADLLPFLNESLGWRDDVSRLGPFLFFPNSFQDEVSELLDSWLAPELKSLALEVELKPTNPEGTPVRLVLPVLAGREAHFFFGNQVGCLMDVDVDVANDSAIANPKMVNVLDGGRLRVGVSRLGEEAVLLAVRLDLSLMNSPPRPVDLGMRTHGSVDALDATTGFLEERVILHLGDEGRSESVPLGRVQTGLDSHARVLARVTSLDTP